MQIPQNPRPGDVPKIAADVLGRLRARAPRVHCLTNAVAQNFTANLLLAVGAVPSMTIAPEEIAQFVSRSEALLVNLGTFDHERREGAEIAVETASQDGVPWVLDPVFIDRTPPRAAFARQLVASCPKIVRLNHSEFSALAGAEATTEALTRYARDHKVVLGLSGETDVITDGARVVAIANGHPLMARVTAVGCAGSALAAACLAVESDPWPACATALLVLGIAGEIAAETARGPGSFAVAIIDLLYGLNGATLIERARVA